MQTTSRIFKSLVGEIQVDYKFKSRPKVKIKTSEDAYKEMRSLFKRISYKEEVFMLLLNRANNSLGWVKISEGGIAGRLVLSSLQSRLAFSRGLYLRWYRGVLRYRRANQRMP